MKTDGFLTLSSVEKTFGSTHALVDCNLAIERGEFITLLGPSGCGKTTTLRLIGGFLRPDSGEIRIGGAVLSSLADHVPPERRNMGMVFQSFAVWPHMTVFDNVALPLRIRGLRRKEIEARCTEILRLCRLEQLKSRDPHQLSGGQLQRVALARALVYRPHVLLLDEPLSNLDATLREEMRRELRAIHQAIRTTFILVTHDQVEAMSLSDRVVVMDQGRIEQIGTPREIYQTPNTSFVAQFVGAANLLNGEMLAQVHPEEMEGLCRVKVEVLELLVRRRRQSVPVGAACTIAIHPESIRLSPATGSPHGDNSFSARVCDVYFLGRTQEVVLDIDGISLRATQFHGDKYASGDPIQVTLAADDVILV